MSAERTDTQAWPRRVGAVDFGVSVTRGVLLDGPTVESTVVVDLSPLLLQRLVALAADGKAHTLLSTLESAADDRVRALTLLLGDPHLHEVCSLTLDPLQVHRVISALVDAADVPRCRRDVGPGQFCLEMVPCPVHTDRDDR